MSAFHPSVQNIAIILIGALAFAGASAVLLLRLLAGYRDAAWRAESSANPATRAFARRYKFYAVFFIVGALIGIIPAMGMIDFAIVNHYIHFLPEPLDLTFKIS